MLYLTRKAEFAASHYYHNPELSPEENRRLFGKCNNPNGHGHNYVLEVTVKGEVDPRSGFVVDLKQLKETMHREVLDAMDHRLLNKEVPEFATRIPTTENLAIAIWQRLAPKLTNLNLVIKRSVIPTEVASSETTEPSSGGNCCVACGAQAAGKKSRFLHSAERTAIRDPCAPVGMTE
ncbi:MAG: hypothetical protein DMG94_13965 [Acidobacteria bacterium]|nr:MAG: hypothetical protein DMG94_13965 [Acidobacteriota bacterium]